LALSAVIGSSFTTALDLFLGYTVSVIHPLVVAGRASGNLYE